MKKLNRAIKATFCGVALSASSAIASDQDLLDTLYQNGVLNKTQYENLSKNAQEKQATAELIRKEKAESTDWTSRVKISGDMRFRREFRDFQILKDQKKTVLAFMLA